MSASSTRLKAIATERAATIATTIHRSFDPEAFARETRVAPGEQCSGEREGQREDGVLELDHFERQAQALQETVQKGATFDQLPF